MNQRKYQFPALFLTMALALLLTACGGGRNTAAAMHLIKTEGTVQVDDARGKSVKIMDNLSLYSGYGVTTLSSSYGWINLDDAKLAKMDERSEVEVRKDDKLLELYVNSGSLFFNVTEPLADDESMDIRTSTMAVGIRGTCGWVEVEGESLMCVYLLRGKVECTVFDEDGSTLASETITAGQAAKMVRDGDAASITVAEFNPQKAPGFVMEEITGDDSLAELMNPEPAGTSAPSEETNAPEEAAPPEETDAPEESGQPGTENTGSLLAPYAGTYTPYELYDSYSLGKTVTVDENGVVTGGMTDGRSPSSIEENPDGSIAILFGEGERYTVYPPGIPTPSYWSAAEIDSTAVNMEYLYTAGGAMNIVYYADSASLGAAGGDMQ